MIKIQDKVILKLLMIEEGIITTTSELAKLKAGTSCGTVSNTCFVEIGKEFPNRKVYGYFDKEINSMNSCVLIQCNVKEAEQIDELANEYDGSLRYDDCNTHKKGYHFFEIE